MNDSMLTATIASLGTLIVTSLYGMATTALRKRVTIRSPEAQAIEQIIPAVNVLIEMQGPQMRAHIATLEALQGQCNGNVTEALVITRAAHARFNDFLTDSARVAL